MPEARSQSDSHPTPAISPIDAHVHVWTTDFRRYPLAVGFTPQQMAPAHFTPEDLFAHSGPAGVRRTVLIQMVFYGNDNSYMLDCIRQYPGVFAGVALIDELAVDPAREMQRLKQFHVRGVRIVPPQRGASNWLNGPEMRAMWATAASERIAMCALVDPEDLPSIDRMCAQFPDTPVVIDHCARIGGGGTIRDSDVAQLCALATHRSIHVKLSAFYFLGAKRPPYADISPMIMRLVEAYGTNRLMWATDCPFQVVEPHTYQASLELIRDRLEPLSVEDRCNILEKTAERVFFS